MGAQQRQRTASAAARARGTIRQRTARRWRRTAWEHGEFVAIDGEGFSDGPEFEHIIGVKKTRYVGKGHSYAYLASSTGDHLYSDTWLACGRCLEFLCDIVGRVDDGPKILVVFGGSYDVTHIVGRELARDQIARLLGKERGPCIFETEDWTYKLEYRPRKVFTIMRWPAGARRWTVTDRGRKATPHLTVRLWDVWGFFQDSFVGVLEKWVPGDPDFEFVRRMKGDRNVFERSEIEEIKRYNAAELRLLVKVMNRVRDAINDLGLKITRWDGAGAVAAAMMTKHNVKAHKGELPPDVFEAVRRAYSGGHIEACKVGYYAGKVYHYDVNSAYPDQFRRLPSLANGRWINGTGPPPDGYTVVKVRFEFPPDLPFYPLFYRCENGAILYPASGAGWYWLSEFRCAETFVAKYGARMFAVEQWHSFISASENRPFSWLEDYYSRRQDYIRAARAGGYTSGPEKIIKLGCSSLYGKTAQQVGARIDADGNLRLPPFFQLDWAGFVTAGCRAKLMEAALQKPGAIIGFATDGLFSTEPLDLYCPEDKELGAWEFSLHDGITMVMPGVYWLHDGETVKHYSRGFDKAEMKAVDFVHDAWRRKQDCIGIKLTRLIGLGSACASKEFAKMLGCFTTSSRILTLDGDNSKRYAINLARERPERGLVDTIPRDHFLPNLLGVPDSAPYPIAWIDGVVQRDLLEGEMADEFEAQDAELA